MTQFEGLCNDTGSMFEVSYGMFHTDTVKQRIGESLGKIIYSCCYVKPYYKIYQTPSGRKIKCVEKGFSNLYILDWSESQDKAYWSQFPDPETGKRNRQESHASNSSIAVSIFCKTL